VRKVGRASGARDEFSGDFQSNGRRGRRAGRPARVMQRPSSHSRLSSLSCPSMINE
jgi:hypothetical protein